MFDDYSIPSLILFGVVGGVLLTAAIAVLAGWRAAGFSARVAGYVALFWICVQLAVIGYVSWMQPATFVAGILVLLLAATLGTPESAGQRRDGDGQ